MYCDFPSSFYQLISLLANIVCIKFCKKSMERVGIDKSLVVNFLWVKMQLSFDMLMPSFRIKLEMARTENSIMFCYSYFNN